MKLVLLQEPFRFLLMRPSPQYVLCRAKKRRGLDTNCSSCRTGLHTGLVIKACAQVAFDRQFFTHLAKRVNRLVYVEGSWGSGTPQHGKRFASALLARAIFKEIAELVPGIARFHFVFERHNRDVIVRAAFSTDSAADAAFGDVNLPAWQSCDTRAAT